ncbi:MAG: hypothetical protein HYV07_03660 [Deltaproteobacteria bacterium]|nr:hypothetical protein [Deltaproteobacteria bacterium]
MDRQGLIRDRAGIQALLSELSRAPFLAVDTETTGLTPGVDRVLLLQVGDARTQGLIDVEAVGVEGVAELLGADRLFVFHHAKFDLRMLKALVGERFDFSRLHVMDTMLAEALLRNGKRSELSNGGLSLAVLAERHAGMELDKSVRETFMAARTVDDLGEASLRYAQRDVEATWKIFANQLRQLHADGLVRTAAIEGAACWAFADMESAGFPIDVAAWRRVLAEAERGRSEVRAKLDLAFAPVVGRDLFGVSTLKYESDDDVLDALVRLGVRVDGIRKESLLASGHPAALALVEFREHQKIVSTYGETFLEHVDVRTGRIHSSFKAIGASSGRAASSEPNLQNIPRGSEFRACFHAPPGRKLVTADYSAAELRILAELSDDPVFIRTFNDGGDLHAIVASKIFGQKVSKTENPELRARAKAINFGLAYGMGAQGLAAQVGISLVDAEALLERYFRAFPAIRSYLEDSARRALKRGYAETIAGRKLWFVDMTRSNEDEGSRVRVAKNMPVQGTNADMIKLAMARICRAFATEKLDARLVNMVHDELVVEASEAQSARALEVLVREMKSAGREFVRRVPIEIDAEVSDTWS